MNVNPYPRDLVGYGRTPPQARWPGEANVAVQFVINYEEGGENSILHGDPASEAFLSEIIGAEPWPGQRHMNMESIYEFGSRAGFWRLWRLFAERRLPVTVFAVATAVARNRDAVAAMQEAGWEIASHGLKWIDYRSFTAEAERAHIQEAIRIHTEVAGERPLGFYQGRTSAHTLGIVMSEGGFLYSADSYADELPYWVKGPHGPHLIVPYTLDANDMRFATAQGFNSGEQFFTYLKDAFDLLYAEGGAGQPKMLSVGLHCRLVGRPGRAAALARFLDYIQRHDRVWVARRIDIARHWIDLHPGPISSARKARDPPSRRVCDLPLRLAAPAPLEQGGKRRRECCRVDGRCSGERPRRCFARAEVGRGLGGPNRCHDVVDDGNRHLFGDAIGQSCQPQPAEDHDFRTVLLRRPATGGGEANEGGLRVGGDLSAGGCQSANRGKFRCKADRRHELLEHRPPAMAAGNDGKLGAQGRSRMAGGFRHAHHRDGGKLAQGKQSRITEAGKQHHVWGCLAAGEGIERGMGRDGGRGAGADVTRAELARG